MSRVADRAHDGGIVGQHMKIHEPKDNFPFHAGTGVENHPKCCIPRSRDTPEVRWVDDTEIICHLVAVDIPVCWHFVS